MQNDERDVKNPRRRKIIIGAGAGAVLARTSAFAASRASRSRKPHVVIIGAGLAGLCTGYNLDKAGCTYTILEAEREYVGGRVRTQPIGNGLYWEAGAMRIPAAHCTVHRYVTELGLKLRPFVMYSAKTFWYAKNTLTTDANHIKSLFNLSDAEKAADLWALSVVDVAKGKDRRFRLSAREQEELRTANSFRSNTLKKLDRMSLRQLMYEARLENGQPLSNAAIEYVLYSSGNTSIQHSAASEFLREENQGVWDAFSEIEGGTVRLPQAFLKKLTSAPKMGCEVTRIEQDRKRGRVRAIYRTGDTTAFEEGDFLICTIPLPVLRRVDIDPLFTPEKRRAIQQVAYDSGTKVAVATKNRFWELKNGIYGGSSTTDLMTAAIVYPSDNAKTDKGDAPLDEKKSSEPGVFLASYSWGQDARRLAALRPDLRVKLVIDQVAQVHPELTKDPTMIQQTASWAWDLHPGAGGAFAWYQPGQFSEFHRHLVAPEGRVYLAGEHCSHSHTWMEGALQSAEAVVKAIRQVV